MSRRLVVLDSDWHSMNWNQFSVPSHAGLNTRVLDNLSVRRQVFEWCRMYHPIARITAGDEFHTPGLTGTLDVAVQKAVIEVEEEFDSLGIPIVKLVGNHDQSTRSGEAHALVGFRGQNLRVVAAPEWIELVSVLHSRPSRSREGVWLLVIPYSRDSAEIQTALAADPGPQSPPTLLTVVHYEMNGAVVETGWRVTSPILVDQLPARGWTWFGHHHTHQMWTSRSGVIGSPLQHIRSDEGSTKGFIVLDLDT